MATVPRVWDLGKATEGGGGGEEGGWCFHFFHCICLCYLLFEYFHIEYFSLCNFCKTNRGGSKINELHVPVSPHHPQRDRLEGDGAGIGRIRMREWSSPVPGGQLKGNCFQSQQVCVSFPQCSRSRAQAWPENVSPCGPMHRRGRHQPGCTVPSLGEEAGSVPCLHWDFIIFSRTPILCLPAQNNPEPWYNRAEFKC